ncbi:hypothetical protein DL769_009109 [Monosporascus sp. CRB-8-3]|nr:hypothetical protein DL769_009109 [Monosporascus sp. CRB-8-3]
MRIETLTYPPRLALPRAEKENPGNPNLSMRAARHSVPAAAPGLGPIGRAPAASDPAGLPSDQHGGGGI